MTRLGRPYWLLWLGETVSRFGDGFFFIAVGWLVYAQTGSVLALGLLWFVRRATTALAKALAAPLADRVDRRHLLVTLDVIRAVLTVAPFALQQAHLLQTWQLYAVLAAVGIVSTPYMPAAYALLPRLVRREDLAGANAWLQGGLEAMYLLGPAAGGLFIASFGAAPSMALDGTSYALCAALIAALPAAAGRVAVGARSARYRASLASGWRTLRSHADLAALTFLMATEGATDMVFGVLMIPLVTEVLHGGAAAVGLLEASLSGGVILASLAAPGIAWNRRPLLLWTTVPVFCLATAGLALAPTLAWAILLQVAAGLANGLFTIRAQTLFQVLVADEYLGRSLGFRDAFGAATQSGSALLIAAIAAGVGVAGAFGVVGALGAAVSLGIAWRGRRQGVLASAAD